MATTTARTLDVRGARLYYEVTGSGPVLAVLGLPMDHTGFAQIVPELADRYTVVTYDPRGFLESTVEDADEDLAPELVADDVHHVLAAVADEPAFVLGSSGGAVTSLALALAHPDQVRLVVAHEPPIAAFLPDAERRRAQVRDIHETYQSDGIGPAFVKFLAMVMPEGAPPIDPRDMMGEPTPEMIATSERMLGHSIVPTTGYEPDSKVLGALADRVVIGVGTTSEHTFAHDAGRALAERAGLRVAEFPGGHDGFISDAGPFAATLDELLRAHRAS